MSINSKRMIFQFGGLILLCAFNIVLNVKIENMTDLPFRDSFFLGYFIDMLTAFSLGMFINTINRKISFKTVKFTFIHLVPTLVCVVLIILLWIIGNDLPDFLRNKFEYFNYIIAIYAGANFISALFVEKEFERNT